MPAGFPETLLGPLGLTIGALFGIVGLARVIVVLWRDHLRADQDDRDQRDRAQSLANKAIEGMGELADAWRERDAYDAQRQRRSDRTGR
jgi:hypothetical protein